jgi:hypothetical protein
LMDAHLARTIMSSNKACSFHETENPAPVFLLAGPGLLDTPWALSTKRFFMASRLVVQQRS